MCRRFDPGLGHHLNLLKTPIKRRFFFFSGDPHQTSRFPHISFRFPSKFRAVIPKLSQAIKCTSPLSILGEIHFSHVIYALGQFWGVYPVVLYLCTQHTWTVNPSTHLVWRPSCHSTNISSFSSLKNFLRFKIRFKIRLV